MTKAFDTIRFVPIVVLVPGCAAFARVGPETKILRADVATEAQATLAIGFTGDEPGSAFFYPVVAFGGGVIPASGRGIGSFEGGFGFASAVLPNVSLRAGLAVGGLWGGHSGSFVGVRPGIAVALAKPDIDRTYPVIVLEALAAPGTSGDVGGSFVGGLGLSFGFETYGAVGGMPHGRPLCEHGRVVVAPVAKRRAWRDDAAPRVRRLSPAVRDVVGRAWLEEARFEHASIATFANLSVQLLACGAPPALVAGAHRAALEEVRHARLCFALAAAYLEDDVDPGALPMVRAAAPTIPTLAAESLVDGALGEGASALLAARRARAAGDPAVVRVLRVIAREERRHAELAWNVLTWSLGQSGDAVADVLRDAWARAAPPPPGVFDAERSRHGEHGVATSRAIAAAYAWTRRRAGRRLDALLAHEERRAPASRTA